MSEILSDLKETVAATLFGGGLGVATPVKYLPAGGAAIETTGIIEYGEDLDDIRWGRVLQARAAVWLDQEVVPQPVVGDAVEIDTMTYAEEPWRVERITTKAAGFVRVEIRRDLRPQFGEGR